MVCARKNNQGMVLCTFYDAQFKLVPAIARKLKSKTIYMQPQYRKFPINGALPIRAHPLFLDSLRSVHEFKKTWVDIYCWKALELYFSNKGALMLCLSALLPY